MQMQREQGVPFPPHLISLEKICELKEIKQTDRDFLHIGALSNLEACLTHPLVKKTCPLLSTAIETIASPAVRNRGTIGGNVLYGIGDALPVLLVLDASISWYSESGIKTKRLFETLSRQLPVSDEAILTEIIVPAQSKGSFFFQKVGRRESFIPSVVTVAMQIVLTGQQEIKLIRIAVGGGLSIPCRLTGSENWLIGKKLCDSTLKTLKVKVQEEAAFVGDVFASADYRRTVTANLLVSKLQTCR